ncbi:hypothetical protein GCM10008018_57520 [Paenibacillus marchantiophytorum]|uniref:DNA-binding protein n=1 Tax=Paenibacillus marchantiophytorum TaxID=1619310 RepID=A0ABQ1FA34_9BACL|nr:hypothetical protein [Paenibacillus marchantiophytorum]GGA04074.1 hypothetical protein GCM10008018_57520 [Paenibacillus marchantiophytorum]
MNKSLIIASCILGMSIFSAGWLISHESENDRGTEVNPIFTENELTEYLHISDHVLQKIISDDQSKRKELVNKGSWDIYTFLPYATIGETKLFMKEEVDKWLKYQALNVK